MSSTIITGETNLCVKTTTRMPVILQEEHHDSWLSGEAGKEVLVPYPADRMKAWPISSRVNYRLKEGEPPEKVETRLIAKCDATLSQASRNELCHKSGEK